MASIDYRGTGPLAGEAARRRNPKREVQALPVAHGAPLRLRLECQLGYKMIKYVMRVQAVDSFAPIGGGKGGCWEDQGHAWYAGI